MADELETARGRAAWVSQLDDGRFRLFCAELPGGATQTYDVGLRQKVVSAAISTDGTTLAWIERVGGSRFEQVCAVRLNGRPRGVQRIARRYWRSLNMAVISSDGSQLAWIEQDKPGTKDPDEVSLQVVEIDWPDEEDEEDEEDESVDVTFSCAARRLSFCNELVMNGDGHFAAFGARFGSHWRSLVVELGTSDTIDLHCDGASRNDGARLSADGNLALWRRSPETGEPVLMLTQLDSGETRPVASTDGPSALSSDGRYAAWARDGAIWATRLEDGGECPVTAATRQEVRSLVISDDDAWIGWATDPEPDDEDRGFSIGVSRLDGAFSQRLFTAAHPILGFTLIPAAPIVETTERGPDGGAMIGPTLAPPPFVGLTAAESDYRLAWISNSGTQTNLVCTVDLCGGDLQRYDVGMGPNVTYVGFSRDGTKVVWRETELDRNDMYDGVYAATVRGGGGDKTRLFSSSMWHNDRLQLSRDGGVLLWVDEPTTNKNWRGQAASTVNLTWSPTGVTLTPRALFGDPKSMCLEAWLSADGGRVAFAFRSDFNLTTPNLVEACVAQRIFLANSDGSGVALASSADSHTNDSQPILSGNGAVLAFHRTTTEAPPADSQLLIISAHGGQRLGALPMGYEFSSNYSLSDDGERVIWRDRQCLWTARSDGSERRPVAVDVDDRPALTPDGCYVAWQPIQGDGVRCARIDGCDERVVTDDPLASRATFIEPFA